MAAERKAQTGEAAAREPGDDETGSAAQRRQPSTGARRWWPLAAAVLVVLAAAWAARCVPAALAQAGVPVMPPQQFLPYLEHAPPPTLPPSPTPTLMPLPAATPTPMGLRPSDFGLVWVNSAEDPHGAARIQRAVDTGAQLDRFPIYWNLIETGPGQFTWTRQDAALAANEAHGLGTLAILLGEPGFYYSTLQTLGPEPPAAGGWDLAPGRATPTPGPLLPVGGILPPIGGLNPRGPQGTCSSGGPPAPRGLDNPAFSDGTDRPGPGKSANPDNPWARWVGQAVNRYKPGGSAGLHVRYWEVWNEEDLCQFWTGTAAQYARLLEVAYLVIKQADPGAAIIWGGLAHYEQPQFLYDLIDTLRGAAMSDQFDGFFDAAAGHHYSIVFNGYQWTARVRDALAAAGWSDKPIWITESGVPICSDFPGPDCPSPWRAAPSEQASYMWQNVAYTRLAGGGPIFQFALHDDCGNIIAPDSPDGFGLIKNEQGSFCSPSHAEQRPAYTAFRLANRYFAGSELLWADIQPTDMPRGRRAAFYDPAAHERRTLIWALDADVTVRVLATGSQARRVALDGSETLLAPANGEYAVALQGPTNRNDPDGSGGYNVGIYGVPYLLIETDTRPPLTALAPLPATSPASFPVSWSANDLGSGLARVALYYQIDAGPWQLWWSGLPGGDSLNVSGSRQFNGAVGQHYRFGVLATDRAGNTAAAPAVQAETWIGDGPPVQTVAVGGQVYDVRGQAAAGKPVSVGGENALSGSDGRFTTGVVPGRWDVRVAGVTVVHGLDIAGALELTVPLRPANDVVTDGDFESGLSDWQAAGSCPLEIVTQPGTQDHALRLATGFVANPGVDGEEGSWGGNSTLSQVIHMPAGHPYLSLRYRVDSQETTTGHDKFEIVIVRNGRPAYALKQGSATDWQTFSLDLSSDAGGDVTLVLNLYQSSPNRPTSAYIDQVMVGE